MLRTSECVARCCLTLNIITSSWNSNDHLACLSLHQTIFKALKQTISTFTVKGNWALVRKGEKINKIHLTNKLPFSPQRWTNQEALMEGHHYKSGEDKSFRHVYHLQLLHTQLFAALQRDPVLLGILQSIIAHSCAQTDHHIHPAEKKTAFYSYTLH